MRKAFWIVLAGAVVWVIAARVTTRIPSSPSVNTRTVEDFLNALTAVAALIGILAGSAIAWFGSYRIQHKPKDRGSDFAGRVVWWGLFGGLATYVLAGLSLTSIGGLAPFEALGPADRMGLIVGYVFQVVAPVTLVVFLISFAVTTRVKAWGGQRVLIPTH